MKILTHTWIRAKDDVDLVECLVSLGIDEIRAGYIIGEVDCPMCDSRLFPWGVSEDLDSGRILVSYVCRGCPKNWVYDVTNKKWTYVMRDWVLYKKKSPLVSTTTNSSKNIRTTYITEHIIDIE